MKKKAILGMVISGLLSLTPALASAATVVVTYTGSIASGTDGLGIFGSTGSSLAGSSYVMNYQFDSTATRVTTGNSDVVYGGFYYGLTSALLSATLTINGVDQAVTGNTAADLGVWNALGNYYESAAVGAPYEKIGANTIVYSDAIFGTYLSSPLSAIDQDLYVANASGGITNSGDPQSYSGYFDFFASGGKSTSGMFASGGTLQVSVLGGPAFATRDSAPAPEPAAWAMMILGFGVVGAAQRRKSRFDLRFAAA